MHFADYGSERIVDSDRLLVLSSQFCSLHRQGVRCHLATAAETGSAAEIPASMRSRASLEALLLNKVVVIQVLSMTDEDTCRVTLPQCAYNQQLIPQLVRSPSHLTLSRSSSGRLVRVNLMTCVKCLSARHFVCPQKVSFISVKFGM